MSDDATMMASEAAPDALTLVPEDGPRYVGSKTRSLGDREQIDAIDRRLDRAVRITRTPRPAVGEAADRFLRGARIAGRLDHPTVQSILGLGIDDDGHPFFVEPHRRTLTLDAWCRGRADAPPRLARRLALFAEVCSAVGYAHRRGVIHGSLTAACIDVGETDEVEVRGWDDAVVQGDRLGGDLGSRRPGPVPTVETDRAALTELLAIALGADRDAVPELAALVDATAEPLDAPDLAARIRGYLDGERNTALRATMSRQLASAAHTALALGGISGRTRALAQARQALALDPSNDAAAAITARLLVEVPAAMPPAAEAALAASDDQVMRQLGVGFIAAFAAFFAYVPLMLAQGVRSPWPVAALAIVTGAMLAYTIRWRARGPYVITWPPMIGCAVVLALYARTYGPFINAPAQAALATMAIMLFPRRPPAWAVFSVLALPVAGNWLLEALDVLPTTMRVADQHAVIHSHIVAAQPSATVIGFLFVTVVLVVVAGVLASFITDSQRRNMRVAVAQSWKVRALAAPLTSDPPPP